MKLPQPKRLLEEEDEAFEDDTEDHPAKLPKRRKRKGASVKKKKTG